MSALSDHLRSGHCWGYFGGSFDPPHRGHLEIARALKTAEKLDGVIIAPSFHPPHRSAPEASFVHRMAMCDLACAEERSFIVSDIESQLSTPGYTVEALSELQRRFRNVSFSVLVGADNLQILSSWNQIEKLLRMAPLIVGSRPQYAQKLQDGISSELSAAMRDRIRIVQSPLINISSSALRDRLRKGDLSAEGLHPDVRRYIEEHKLYQ